MACSGLSLAASSHLALPFNLCGRLTFPVRTARSPSSTSPLAAFDLRFSRCSLPFCLWFGSTSIASTMAFRQHVRPQGRQLAVSNDSPLREVQHASTSSLARQATHASEEWVLFSPSAACSTTTRTHTTSTERTPRTTGLSRLSDFGSLDTAARSDGDELLTHQDEDDAEELDSLDDGLHAFHEPSEYGENPDARTRAEQSTETVLPSHDGLGTFPASSSMLQEQLWQFETRLSQRRRPTARRRSSVQRTLGVLEEGHELWTEDCERRQRIESWRLEQSRALLEEIEKETRRRRRMSMANASTRANRTEDVLQQQNTQSQPAPVTAIPEANHEPESLSFLQRVTRRVIRDLMGIDDNMLSVIFGESLIEEDLSTTPTSSTPRPNLDLKEALNGVNDTDFHTETWQYRFLERIARELGVLVHHLTEHPGAFETYLRTQEPLPYAGLSTHSTSPTILSDNPIHSTPTDAHRLPLNPGSATFFSPTLHAESQAPAPYNEASLWGIEEETAPPAGAILIRGATDATHHQKDKEYWERDLDAKMVFRYLLRRFSSRSSSPTYDRNAMNTDDESSSAANNARRAAIIRQNHPLVAASSSRRRDLSHRRHLHHSISHSPPLPPLPPQQQSQHQQQQQPQPQQRASVLKSARSRGSSCASQSTRRSRKSGSSRNYWDLGGSVRSAPGLGAWGEV